MTWNETHRRWQALREVEATLDETLVAGPDAAALPWNDEYAALFGDPDGLVTALRYRWNLALQAQMDPEMPEAYLEQQYARLSRRQAGVLRLLARAGGTGMEDLRATA